MTPRQIDLIRETWTEVAGLGLAAADLFYDRLFETAPETQPMFMKTDMAEQKKKLLGALSFVVAQAHMADQLLPALQTLGRKHVGYGVEDHHYDAVGSALIWTLEQGLADAFTDEVRDAWVAAYTLVADTMRDAAREQANTVPSAA